MYLYLQKFQMPVGPDGPAFGDGRLYRRRGEVANEAEAAGFGRLMRRQGFGVILCKKDLGRECPGNLLVEGGGEIINNVAS